MRQKMITILFFLVLLVPTLWMTGKGSLAIYRFVVMSASDSVTSIEWSVVSPSDSKHQVHANYTFTVNGTIQKGETTWASPSYRNHWAAERKLQDFQKREWRAFYSPGNPDLSTLDRAFPYKTTAYALILWALTLYFFWLYLAHLRHI